jgi:hypothetical protein
VQLDDFFAVQDAIADAGDLGPSIAGWNMNTSPFLDEIREEGREEGRAEEARSLLVQMGQQKFGKAPTKKHRKTLEGITDRAWLETLAGRLLDVNSWGELLGEG